MKALIFAAGRGTRIKEVSGDLPKCLLELEQGKTVIENLLDTLLLNNIKDVVIAIGYQGEKIIEKLGENYRGINIIYAWNKDYEATNSSYSFYSAKDLIKEGCLHFNGDNIMHPKIMEILINSEKKDVFMYDDITPACDEDGKVRVDERGVMVEVSKKLDNKYHWIIGSGKLSADGVRKAVEIMESDMERWKKVNIPIVLCEKGLDVYVVSSRALPFCEVDNAEDLKIAREEIYPLIKKEIEDEKV